MEKKVQQGMKREESLEEENVTLKDTINQMCKQVEKIEKGLG